ncbi:cobalamin-dependent methionine synthase I [Saccharomonospora marina XMU15]|uniref:Cobalamin-dependent methionine synthase I n=1 Tax=Saccharomonospora marina XMU15 TaxID=882083 RepID=H5X1S7_9PSEU|nr:bifunctional homocysteine S-methyltransferase/methylenetetrahydrofolate reductase [Saccharomonospora marina]EHR50940.1 cobalamin-dependent methionine synthase I [Saccharomonospora marina XMU15]
MSDFAEAVRERLLVCDGAMGTMLHAAGNSLDRSLPELNLSNPELVSTVHESYVDAGADILLTNTFGASRPRLAEHGFSGDPGEINRAGVRLARQAARQAGRPIFVGGSVAPAVSAGRRTQVGAADRAAAVREQVLALADAGVDLLVLETFGYLDELAEAVVTASAATGLPILAQATFTAEGHTPGGQTPHEVVTALAELDVAALGVNCTVGPQRMLAVVEQLRRHTTLPLSAQPNAGLPRRVHGRRFEYSLDHDYFARYARRCAERGVSIVGGCCGTTPGHVRAIAAAVSELDGRRTSRGRAAKVAVAAPAEQGGLARRLADGDFVVAAEIAPPQGGVAEEAAELAADLRQRGAELILVSGAGGARAQLNSTSLALHLQSQVGTETIATVTTWDKTIMSLQADLLGAHAFGARTVVCETGNPPLRGDYPNADGIWEVDSVGLVELVAGLNDGRDCDGLSLATKTSFHIGARCNPGAEDVDAEIARTRAKIAAGAQFLITRPVYELTTLRWMVAELSDEGVPIIVAVSPLSGFAEAEFLAYEVPDVTVPISTLSTLAQRERAGDDGRGVGLRLASELVEQARSLADGVLVVVRDHDADAAARLLAAATSPPG